MSDQTQAVSPYIMNGTVTTFKWDGSKVVTPLNQYRELATHETAVKVVDELMKTMPELGPYTIVDQRINTMHDVQNCPLYCIKFRGGSTLNAGVIYWYMIEQPMWRQYAVDNIKERVDLS